MNKYLGRLAPSPTGLLHLGHAYAFHIAAERAGAAGGQLLLRMDDLDRHRCLEDFVNLLLEDLDWLKLRWTPPIVRQSQRVVLYRAALEELIAAGLAYPCLCSRRNLQQSISAPHDEDDEPLYPGRCRDTPVAAFQFNRNYRLRTPDGESITVHDLHLGDRTYVCGRDFGDFLLWRKDGVPSYQLATVVDDSVMDITEVVRGRDLLKSAARQMLIARGLKLKPPRWFHVDLVLDDQGVRLAKRHDALAIRTLRDEGYTPEEVFEMAQRRVTSVISDC